MIKLKNLLVALSLWLPLAATASDTDAIKKQIANVKKSSQYIYAEAVAATEEEAKNLAEELLYAEINKWADTRKKMQGKTIVVSNKKEIQTDLSLPRGNMFRSFIYVKKSDIISTTNAGVIEATPAAEVPSATVAPVYPEVVNIIASYTDYHQMAEKIKELKEAGRIGHYARYGSLERPEIYYLAIYNQQGEVLTVLTPGNERRNVKTGQPDKVTNYSGCGAIGFTVSE